MRAKAAQADGIHMPGFTYDQSLGEIKRVTTGAPFTEGKDAAAVRRRQGARSQTLVRTPARSRRTKAKAFEAQLADVMKEQMKPAYDRVAAFITEDKPNAPEAGQAGRAGRCRTATDFYNAALYLCRPRPT